MLEGSIKLDKKKPKINKAILFPKHIFIFKKPITTVSIQLDKRDGQGLNKQ